MKHVRNDFIKSKTNWTGPEQFGPVQTCFGPIERQGMILYPSPGELTTHIAIRYSHQQNIHFGVHYQPMENQVQDPPT